MLLMHKKGKYPEYGSGPGAGLLESRHGLNQIGGSIDESSLKQNKPNSPRTRFETGSRIDSEPISPSNQDRMESTSVNPRPSKHQSSHPLD